MTDFVGGMHDDMRIRKIQKEREEAQKALEDKKRQLREEAQRGVQQMGSKFASADDSLEERLKKETIGLRSFDEYRRQRESLQEEVELRKRRMLEEEEARKKKQKVTDTKKLSFSMDDEEEQDEETGDEDSEKKEEKTEDGDKEAAQEEEEEPVFSKRITKNPLVNTDFLPDRERELKEAEERARLAAEWRKEQERIKQEKIEVTYSYWDGSGHRRTIKCKKGTTISQFLSMVQQEFKELRAVSVDNLLFVKEDLIIPQQISFYDLIVTKARGKSGPLFSWDVHDDVRLLHDATKEKDESHAAKVVERRWYERNKHIFPASRWEVYDPAVKRDEKYTIKDKTKP